MHTTRYPVLRTLIVFFVLIAFKPQAAVAQDLIPFRDGTGKWGFKKISGEIVIWPNWIFQPVPFTSTSYIVTGPNQLQGLIDSKGTLFVPYQYKKIEPYPSGFARVTSDYFDTVRLEYLKRDTIYKKVAYNLINSRGQKVIEGNWSKISGDFTNWYVHAENFKGQHSYFDTSGQLIPISDPNFRLTQDSYQEKYVAFFKSKAGVVDKNLNVLLPFEYSAIRFTRDGRMLVTQNSKTGVMSSITYKWLLPPDSFRNITPFVNGHAIVTTPDNRTGIINNDLKITVPPQYNNISRMGGMTGNIVAYQRQGSTKRGLLDVATGKEITAPILEASAFGYNNGLIDFRRDGKRGLMDSTGKELFFDKYDDFVIGFLDGRAWVRKDGKYGFMDSKGREIVAPVYESVLGFSEGLARVAQNGKHGFIDVDGNIAIPLQYKHAESFKGGAAQVTDEKGRNFYIDKSGRELPVR